MGIPGRFLQRRTARREETARGKPCQCPRWRTAVYVLAAERQSGQTLTMGDALPGLADITEAARTIGAILQIPTREPGRGVAIPF